MKTCRVCSETKELELFIKKSNICKTCHGQKCKEYNLKNKEVQKLRRKEHYQANKEKIKAERANYVEQNREKVNASSRATYKKYEEKNRARAKEKYYKDPKKDNAKTRAYYRENKEEKMAYSRDYRNKNKDVLNEKNRKRSRHRYHNCPKTNLIERLRKRTRSALKTKSFRKTKGTLDYLGCTGKELQAYIESLFINGMSWENKHLWHIDHIIPISSGNSEEEILKLNHYTNLQPLWALDNIKKSNKTIKPQKEEELCQGQQAEKD